jgi:protein-tyrosine phosphatase
VIRVPLDDAQITNIEFARAIRAAQKVSDLRRVGKRVLVTCAMGINRSAFVAALSLMQLNRLTAAQAVQHIRQIRGQQTVIPPLSNPSFVEALRRFEDAHR